MGGNGTSVNNGGSTTTGGVMASAGSAPYAGAGAGPTLGGGSKDAADESGCSCRVVAPSSEPFRPALLAIALAGLAFARRRKA
jgi:MYXO-CTERM domain-containing protein